MKKEQANKWLQSISHSFVIVGYRPDGYRDIPATYMEDVMIAKTEDDLLLMVDIFTDFKVFGIQEDAANSEWWKKRATEFKNRLNETEERDLLQKLKDKYEK